MKKYLLLSVLFVANAVNVNAQNNEERIMQVYRGGSVSPQSIPVSEIDSVTFIIGEIPPPPIDKDVIIKVANVEFTMKFVDSGSFTMGMTQEQNTTGGYDEPKVEVTLTKSYSIGETEVTQALWVAVMGNNPSTYKGETKDSTVYPVERVSWDDIVGTNTAEVAYKINGITYYTNGFCYKLSLLVNDGKKFRLPTEAEWEYAARGGSKATTQTAYSGSSTIDDVAWYISNTGGGSLGTQAIKQKAANALGLYDMSGNVLEWCGDLHGGYSTEPQTDPIGASTGYNRVQRGGCFENMPRACRVSHHAAYGVSNANAKNLGFRLAL